MFSTSGSVRAMIDRKDRKKKKTTYQSAHHLENLMPCTPINRSTTPTIDYSATMDGTPCSTFERPLTPVPHWPLPRPRQGNHQAVALTKIKEVRPSASKASLSGRDAQPRSPRLTSGYSSITGHFLATPPLPPDWTTVHDRAICVLDACDYSLETSIKKIRSAFPELAGSMLTPVMIDKRLRTLDQNPNIDFFRIGLEHLLLTHDEKRNDESVSKLSNANTKARIDQRTPMLTDPSFSTISTGRQGSGASDSLREVTFKTTPESERSMPSSKASKASKIPVATGKSVVRSYPFGTGYLSYRTTADDETPPRTSSMMESPSQA